MGGMRASRAMLAVILGFGGACAALLVILLPSAGSASSGRASASLAALAGAPRPPRMRGLAEARADRPDPVARRLVRGPASALPSGAWAPLGPAPIGPPYQVGGGFYGGANSGRITGLAVVKLVGTNVPRIVAGTAGGGIWTSDNNGATWALRTATQPDIAIGAVAVDPKNPEHLIAGTGEANQSADSYAGDGILVSTTGGNTWALQNPGGVFTGKHIAEVAIDPSNANHQFAATDGGLYVTTNGGVTWAKPTSASYTTVDGNITGVVINPTSPKIVYISGGAKTVAKSTDGGLTWAAANTGIAAPGTAPLVAIAIAPSVPTALYVSVGSVNQPVALYKSVNSALTWVKQVATPDFTGQAYSYGSGTAEQGWYDNVLAVDPTKSGHLLAGGIALVETTTAGASWSNVNGGSFFGGGTNKIHPDHHALAFSPDGSVWIGDDGGVFHYTPSTGVVTNANGNLNITQFYYGFNVVGNAVLAGSQDNSSARTTSPTLAKWTGLFGGDGGPSAITPNDTAVEFIEADTNLYVTTNTFVSVLNNITPPAVSTTGSLFTPPEIVVPSTATPSNPTLFYGGQDLFRTTNPTAATPTWKQVTSAGSKCINGGTCVSAIAASPTTPSVIYVGFTNSRIEVSTNGGLTFTSLKAQALTDTFVTGISVNPTNPKAITVSFSYNDTRFVPGLPHVEQYVYTASPATGTWTTITGSGLPDAVSHVIYDGSGLVAATDSGVYGTAAPAGSATSWTRIGTVLPFVQTQDVFKAPNGFYAITHGLGAWKLNSTG
jgi:hypothetical protein